MNDGCFFYARLKPNAIENYQNSRTQLKFLPKREHFIKFKSNERFEINDAHGGKKLYLRVVHIGSMAGCDVKNRYIQKEIIKKG